MNAEQISIKIHTQPNTTIESGKVIPIFHKWIQEQVVPELLIDVADYGHVHQGPGILLVGHEADYSFNDELGRLGISYHRKRSLPGTFPEKLRLVIKQALRAAVQLEDEPVFAGKLVFSGNDTLLQIRNRLLAPNTQATFAAVEAPIKSFFELLYGNATLTVNWISDPKALFSVHIKGKDPLSAKSLLSRL